ncbi:hypothetical protein HWV62_14690 [Athelia sp. TMB]|nr:hypothetical protein HWV62_14690 [Athelia sp. TMB]
MRCVLSLTHADTLLMSAALPSHPSPSSSSHTHTALHPLDLALALLAAQFSSLCAPHPNSCSRPLATSPHLRVAAPAAARGLTSSGSLAAASLEGSERHDTLQDHVPAMPSLAPVFAPVWEAPNSHAAGDSGDGYRDVPAVHSSWLCMLPHRGDGVLRELPPTTTTRATWGRLGAKGQDGRCIDTAPPIPQGTESYAPNVPAGALTGD